MNALTQRDLRNRILSARGHMTAVVAMMDHDAPCAEILRQTLAVNGAIRALKQELWRAYLLDAMCGLRAPKTRTRQRAWRQVRALFSVEQRE